MTSSADSGTSSEQERREQAQRDTARGLRAQAVLRGDLGPVLRRWVSASVLPTSGRVRTFAECVLKGDLKRAGLSINSPVFGLPEVHRGKSLEPILKWCLKGSSIGRASDGTTYAEDLVLSVLGTAIMLCSGADHSRSTHGDLDGDRGTAVVLTGLLRKCAEAARECAMGQFLTQVQGAKTMVQVRNSTQPGWSQRGKMDAIAALLAGQVRSGIDDDKEIGGKETVLVQTTQGDKKQRRIELRVPSQDDWELLDVARKTKGEADVYQPAWITFAMIVVCAAQAEAGLFDLVKLKWNGKGNARGIILSPEAFEAIKVDLTRWMDMGFVNDPMLVPPVNGDYLTVHHRPVSGANGPGGHRTRAEGTDALQVASRVLAGTAWSVSSLTYAWLRSEAGAKALEASTEDPKRRAVIMGAYARVPSSGFYLPIFMDFRGRLYPRTSLVTYQGNDLQKGLLCFPPNPVGNDLTADGEEALIRHCAGLWGLDKAPMPEREAWWYSQAEKPLEAALEGAKKPIQLYTALSLVRMGQADRVPVQIDGTCNGLQHLTALFRDETAAKHVNLTPSGLGDTPGDIYAEVARLVRDRLLERDAAWARRLRATLKIDRSVTKGPVMVLPYGGTLEAIVQACKAAVLEQGPVARINGMDVNPWQECLVTDEAGLWVRDEDAVSGNYLAFRDRPLDTHPLLSMDVRNLGGLIWQAIVDTLPRPMAAMKTFRGIAKYVGERSLEWRVAPVASSGADVGEPTMGNALWVVQAKAKSETKRLNMKGFHLPASVRGLALRIGRDEVDPRSHSSGIVANFIHSHDADHLVRTMRLFSQVQEHGHRPSGTLPSSETLTSYGTSSAFGSNHDCFITRPSLMPRLMVATREAFREKYRSSNGEKYQAGPPSGSGSRPFSSQHPLRQPVRLCSLGLAEGTTKDEAFADWYALAEASGADPFPELGSWDPDDVMHSAWFFS